MRLGIAFFLIILGLVALYVPLNIICVPHSSYLNSELDDTILKFLLGVAILGSSCITSAVWILTRPKKT